MDWAAIIASAITGVFGFACGVYKARHEDKATVTAKRIEAIEKYFNEAGLCLNSRKLSIHFKTATEVLIPYLSKKTGKNHNHHSGTYENWELR